MKIEECYILRLIRAYLNDKGFDDGSDDINWNDLYNTAHFHGIANLLYYVLEHFNISASPEIANTLILEHDDYIGLEAWQELEMQNLISIFEEEGIDCMPMKGYILKNMYPLVDMREMCDMDILIREADYSAIKNIMEENGFTFDSETPHEYIFKKGEMINIELHKCVVPPYNNILYDYYGDGWKLADKQPGYEHIYEMSIEDFYVYILVHTAKHYLNSGIGIRQVLDLWFMERKNPEIDYSYVKGEIEKLGLTRFYENITELMNLWFDGKDTDNEAVIRMEEYIMHCGVRGVVRQEKIAQIYKNSDNHSGYGEGYRSYLLKAFFPSVEMISLKYPMVKKCVLLYPFCWVHRLFRNLFFEREKLNRKFARNGIKYEEVQKFALHCEVVGIRNDL